MREGAAPVALTDRARLQDEPAGRCARARRSCTPVAAQSPLAARGAGPAARAAAAAAVRGGGGRRRGGARPIDLRRRVTLADKTTRNGHRHGSDAVRRRQHDRVARRATPDGTTTLNMAPAATAQPTVVRTTTAAQRIDAPALSPDGKLVAYQLMTQHRLGDLRRRDAAGAHRRLTRDIQHDLLPRFLTQHDAHRPDGRSAASPLAALRPGDRHADAAVREQHDPDDQSRVRLDAERGRHAPDPRRPSATATPSRPSATSASSISRRKISMADLQARLDRQLAAETDLRQRMTTAFKPVDATRRARCSATAPSTTSTSTRSRSSTSIRSTSRSRAT